MKTIYTLILCFFLFGLYAQTAPDFDVTDTHGEDHSLYADYLDQGKTVVLDLFFVDCPPCNELSPLLEPVYQSWGAGTADVEFISLTADLNDTIAKVLAFEELHGTTWPAVSVEGGGPPAQQPYTTGDFGAFFGYPTLIVISPDGSVQFKTFGIIPETPGILDEMISNTGAVKPLVAVSDLDNVQSFSFAPNPVSETAILTFELNEASEASIDIYNNTGQIISHLFSGTLSSGVQSIQLDASSLSSGVYFVRVAMKDQVTMQQFIRGN